VPQRKRLGAHFYVSVSRLELSQHRQAARRAVAGRYACDFKDSKFNVAQVPRVDSYRGFIFATLNPDAPSLLDYLGAITKPIDEWLDRQPKGKIAVCEATGSNTRATGSSPTTIPATAITSCSLTASLLEMENRQADVANKGMSLLQGLADIAPMYMAYMGNGHHFKDKRPNIQKRGRRIVAVEGPAPGTEHYAEELRRRFGARAEEILDLASFGTRQHQRVPELLAARQPYPGVRTGLGRRDQRHLVRHGGGRRGRRAGRRSRRGQRVWRMRTQEQFPNFGEVDDLANFEEIQRGLACLEDEWVYMHSRARYSRPGEDGRERHQSPRLRPTKRSARIHQRMEAADEGDAPPPVQREP